ncbi:hypothetical protein [Embleya sp. MST-111070]
MRDVREWLKKLSTTCQCCAQDKDERRPPARASPLLRDRQVL